MARARIQGTECEVRVTRDITDNWAVEIAPILKEPRKWEPFKASPSRILLKVRSDTREAAAKAALETLKEAGRIDEFYL